MANGLVGHTGFVGTHLRTQHPFEALFNSSNIAQISDGAFQTLVCAAAPGSMFEANRDPEADFTKVSALMNQLDEANTDRFILISSIAVFAAFDGQDDEGSDAFAQELAYGRNRRALEAFCQERFAECLIVRLPALFGTGLKKNLMFDLLNPMPSMLNHEKLSDMQQKLGADLGTALTELYHANAQTGLLVVDRGALAAHPARRALEEGARATGTSALQFHNADTTYQFYDMTRLWADIGIAQSAGLDTIHLTAEPVPVARIHDTLLGHAMSQTGARLHKEDMRTRHADVWGKTGPYLTSQDAVLSGLKTFFDAEQAT